MSDVRTRASARSPREICRPSAKPDLLPALPRRSVQRARARATDRHERAVLDEVTNEGEEIVGRQPQPGGDVAEAVQTDERMVRVTWPHAQSGGRWRRHWQQRWTRAPHIGDGRGGSHADATIAARGGFADRHMSVTCGDQRAVLHRNHTQSEGAVHGRS